VITHLINENAKPIPFAQFQAHVESLYEPPQRAKATATKMQQVLRITSGLLPAQATTADLDTALVARFVASRAGKNANTTFGLLSNLRAACALCVAEGWLRFSPWSVRSEWIRRVPTRRKQHHSLEEIGRVLALAARDVERKRGWARWRAQRLQAMVANAAYTGMRKREILFLRREDILIDERIILIVERQSNRLKTEKSSRQVPIPDALAPILEGWLAVLAQPVEPFAVSHDDEERPPCRPARLAMNRAVDEGWFIPNAYRTAAWTGGSSGRKPLDRLKSLGRRAHVDGFTFQSLRHSFGTHGILAWGLSVGFVSRCLGHTSERTTRENYLHSDMPDLRAAVRHIDFGPTPVPLQSVAPAPAAPVNGSHAPAPALSVTPVPVPQLARPYAPGERPSVEAPDPTPETQDDAPDVFGFTITFGVSAAKVVKRGGRPRKRGARS
jgi:integrase